MAYLGALGTDLGWRDPTLAWSRFVISEVVLADVVGLFQSYGGYVYVG